MVFCLKGKSFFQHNPGYEEHNQGEGHHHHHPLAEAYAEVHTGGVVEELQSDGVGRCTDRSTYTTDISAHGYGQCQAYLTLAVGGKSLKHRRQEGEHHSCGGSVAYKHGENGCNEQEAQQHSLRLGAERRQHHLGQLHVETTLGSGDSHDKTTDKQHDGRVGKSNAAGRYCSPDSQT